MNHLYDEWFEYFDFQRDVRLQHHALYLSLVEKDIINAEIYNKHWYALMENDLQHIRKNLKRKTKNKKDKSGFSVFAFLKRSIFRK